MKASSAQSECSWRSGFSAIGRSIHAPEARIFPACCLLLRQTVEISQRPREAALEPGQARSFFRDVSLTLNSCKILTEKNGELMNGSICRWKERTWRARPGESVLLSPVKINRNRNMSSPRPCDRRNQKSLKSGEESLKSGLKGNSQACQSLKRSE